ncbi:MAG: glycosyltransferase, partial [Candidatus Omnitrophota bacterium]
MKVSIITDVLNSEDTIESSIKSVLQQTYKDIEYIVVDGVSKDKTIDIIKKYDNRIHKFVSEPDKNHFDAMNKG